MSSNKALDKLFKDQLALAGERSIPITIVVLLLVLGALVAVGLPILLALTGVVATIGLVAMTSHALPADSNVNAVILLIGLAVGVDYSLFYIKRWREERAAGQRAGRRSRGRRRDLGPLGPDLRLHGPDRDGGVCSSPPTRRSCPSGSRR